jgi:hypothetical protein
MFYAYNNPNSANTNLPPIVQRMTNPGASNIRNYPEIIMANTQATNIDFTNTDDWVNPVANVTLALIDVSSESRDVCIDVVALEGLKEAAQTAFQQTTEFLMHTNRLCGKTPAGTDEVDRPVPYLIVVANIGRSLSFINYVQNNIVDDTYLKNNFASAYTYSNLASILAEVDGYPQEISSSIVYGESSNTTILTTQRINEMTSSFSQLTIFVDEKREADEQAFVNSTIQIRSAAANFINTISQAQANMVNSYTQTS